MVGLRRSLPNEDEGEWGVGVDLGRLELLVEECRSKQIRSSNL